MGKWKLCKIRDEIVLENRMNQNNQKNKMNQRENEMPINEKVYRHFFVNQNLQASEDRPILGLSVDDLNLDFLRCCFIG